jgi:hypothetical protein
MARIRRSPLATTVAMAAVSGVLAVTPASAAPAPHAIKYAHALAAVKLFKQNGLADVGLPATRALWVRACYVGVCAHDRLRPDPVCDPEAAVCLGPALRAVRVSSRLIVTATYR